MNKNTLNRLTKIRDHLFNNVKDEKFNLHTWAGNESIPFGGDQNLSCGTTACAIGHACSIPEFQKLGLKLVKDCNSYNTCAIVKFNEYDNLDAVIYFLDMDQEKFIVEGKETSAEKACQYLFYSIMYTRRISTSKQEVIDRIDSFIAENKLDC